MLVSFSRCIPAWVCSENFGEGLDGPLRTGGWSLANSDEELDSDGQLWHERVSFTDPCPGQPATEGPPLRPSTHATARSRPYCELGAQ